VTNCYTELHLHRSFDTEQFANIYKDFFAKKKLRKDAFTHRSHRSLYTETLWRTEVDAQKLVHAKISTQMHKNVLSQSNFYTHIFLHGETEAVAQSRFYTETFLHREAATQSSFYKQKFSHRETCSQE